MLNPIALAILLLGTLFTGLLQAAEQPAGKPATQPTIVSIWGGAQTHMVLKSDGTVWMWGLNMMGQLGDGTTTNRCAPVQVVGPAGQGHLDKVTAIMGGEM